MKVHFIAIGGSAMHNLAIALHRKGYQVSGSDDQIFDPSRSRLDKHGLLPRSMGWDVENINSELDAIILGMHARPDNPELKKALELGLKIYSYPEYIFEQTKNKKRVVIGGSHGKTTITSMILHILKDSEFEYDYMVGAQLEGYDCMVKLSEGSELVILEGDEYLSSPIDRRPKFHHYRPHVAVLTGIAWDHINVFPTFENYVEQFSIFSNLIEENGKLLWFDRDENLKKIDQKIRQDVRSTSYDILNHTIRNGKTFLITDQGEIPLEIFGKHNLQNLNAAIMVCEEIGLKKEQILSSISTFTGASKRLEKLQESQDFLIMKDFAHSPSKLEATTKAMKEQYPERQLVAVMELHTFSSLNSDFLNQYKGSMNTADKAIVFYSKEALAHKKMPPLSKELVKTSFGNEEIEIIDETSNLIQELQDTDFKNSNLLLMSSGNFGGIQLDQFAQELMDRHLKG